MEEQREGRAGGQAGVPRGVSPPKQSQSQKTARPNVQARLCIALCSVVIAQITVKKSCDFCT